MEYRYRDKAYLSNYMLDTELFDYFDFLVEDATPVRSIFILNTDKGMKILKKVDYSEEEIMFIYNSLNKIRELYPHVINFKESIFNKPYIEYEGGLYVVIDIIEGRECVFENPIDLMRASGALARLHIAGENIGVEYEKRNNLGKMIDRFRSKMLDMEKYKEIALMHKNKKEFDRVYLEYADYYIDYIKEAISQLENSSYLELCGKYHTLCHHDLAHHNILMGNDDEVYFIDFDYSIIDLPYHDISNMLTKAIKHNGWDINIAENIMEAYMEKKPMSKDEINILYGFLLFPQDFYDISTSYYMQTRSWEEDDFVDKLKRKAGYKKEREEFLKEFYKTYIEK